MTPLVDLVCGITSRFGRDRGGMYVEASGIDHDGRKRRRSFDLSAEGESRFIFTYFERQR